MKWITLKPNNLPIVALEIDRAIQVFNSLLNQAQTLGNPDDISQVEALARQFQIRINQLDAYYRQHSMDENISIFHMLNLKLQKTLFLFYRSEQKHKKSYQDRYSNMQIADESLFLSASSKILDKPLFEYYENSPRKNSSKSIKKNQIEEKTQKKGIINHKNLNQKVPQKVPNSSKISSRVSSKPDQGNKQIKKMTKQEAPKVKQISRPQGKSAFQGIQTPAFKEELINPAELLEQMRHSSDLKFTIKMTKQQYKQLLERKQQMKIEGKL